MYKIPYNQLKVTDAKITTANYYIDCGAGLSLLLTESFVKDSGILRSSRVPLPTQVDGVGGKSNMRITTVKQFKMGKYSFKNVPTFLYNDETDLLGYPGIVGLIGNDILRRFNWILDYKERHLHLTPNTNYHDKFDYSYTGLGIYLIEGFITVTDIVKGSPGEKAGLKEGDIIISIDNTVVAEVKKAKELFQQANKKVKMIIIRNQKPMEIKLKIGRIK
jgi:membrane-associated protease RseP (regulator of RpoE activity)